MGDRFALSIRRDSAQGQDAADGGEAFGGDVARHLEAADIALFMVDATEGVSGLDATIAGYAHESGRSVIIVVNKWDLVTSGEKRAISQSKAARIQDAKRPQDREL